jgi:hypothetical protein
MTPPVPAHPSRLTPGDPLPKELLVQVTFNEVAEDAFYQLVVPFGESLRLAAQVNTSDPYQCDRIAVSQGDDPWFEVGHVEDISTMSKNGISCDVVFDVSQLAVTIVNKNRSGKTIVMRVVPHFTNGKRRLAAKDPQIVLPPEKYDVPASGAGVDEDVRTSG